MKLSKSKLALAKVINEHGGWPSDEANFAAQDKIDGESNDNTISFYSGKVKPTRLANNSMWRCENSGSHFMGYEKTISGCELIANWHQACLSIEEYYQAYPKDDADGWIEWNGGMKGPVESGVPVDVKTKDGYVHYDQLLGDACWRDHWGDASIIAYRLHNPEVKPEFCESVTRSIPEPESHEKLSPEAIEDAKFALMSDSIEESKRKPTIEQLAQDYRNAKGYADRLQKEAGEAAAKAEEFAVEIRKKLLELQELIGIPNPEKEHELEITDWRDLMVGDEVECTKYATAYRFGVVCRIDESSEEQPIMVNHGDGKGTSWPSSWKFIRRP